MLDTLPPLLLTLGIVVEFIDACVSILCHDVLLYVLRHCRIHNVI